MSDNRARAHAHRTDDKHDKALRDYATQFQIEPWRALEVAIGRLKDPAGPAIDRLTRERDEATKAARVANVDRARAEQTATDERAATEAALRLAERREEELASAREATRRADAEVERLTRELAASQARERQADDAAMNARDDLAEERLASKGVDAVLRNARAQIADLAGQLTEVRAALETKGAADRLAERVETIAGEVYAGFSDDFEAKITERASGWKGTPAELRARVITLGFSRYDALATDAAKRAAERGR